MKIKEIREKLFKENELDIEMLLKFTPEQSYNYFKKKNLVLSSSYKEYLTWLHEKVFTVAGLTNKAILGDVFNSLEKAIRDGKSLAEFKGSIRDSLIKQGYLGQDIQIIDEVILTTPYRLNTIFRQNLQSAYSAGRMKFQIEDSSKPYWQYRGVNDNNTRNTHRNLQLFFDGKVLHYSNPFWQSYYPPNGFLCRCFVRSFSLSESNKRGFEIITDVPNELLFNNVPFNVSPIK